MSDARNGLDSLGLPCSVRAMNISRVRVVDVPSIVAALDAVSAADPERAHSEADEIVLDAVAPEVRAAYDRLVSRCRWWATA